MATCTCAAEDFGGAHDTSCLSDEDFGIDSAEAIALEIIARSETLAFVVKIEAVMKSGATWHWDSKVITVAVLADGDFEYCRVITEYREQVMVTESRLDRF